MSSSPASHHNPDLEHDEGAGSGQSDFEDVVSSNMFISSRSIDSTPYGESLTTRSVITGLVIGVLICFCNIYFGLQTGWGSGMSMPAALIGYSFFRSVSAYVKLPFTPAENVLVQTIAGSAGTMSLGCGFVGIIPAIEFLLREDEGAPIILSVPQLVLWSLGISIFGSVFAVVLRKEIIVRERLKFPGGKATALLIRVLHGKIDDVSEDDSRSRHSNEEERYRLLDGRHQQQDDLPIRRHLSFDEVTDSTSEQVPSQVEILQNDERHNKVQYLLIAFMVSGSYVSVFMTKTNCN